MREAAIAHLKNNRRNDGVCFSDGPYAPGMAEKYGLPGHFTDDDGFDPYAYTVSAGLLWQCNYW